MGLAHERWNLDVKGLPKGIIDNQECDSLFYMLSLLGNWKVFEEWCEGRQVLPFQCTVVDILSFLQGLLKKKKRAFLTMKIYLATISACHVGFGNKPVGHHPLVCHFMKGDISPVVITHSNLLRVL